MRGHVQCAGTCHTREDPFVREDRETWTGVSHDLVRWWETWCLSISSSDKLDDSSKLGRRRVSAMEYSFSELNKVLYMKAGVGNPYGVLTAVGRRGNAGSMVR